MARKPAKKAAPAVEFGPRRRIVDAMDRLDEAVKANVGVLMQHVRVNGEPPEFLAKMEAAAAELRDEMNKLLFPPVAEEEDGDG